MHRFQLYSYHSVYENKWEFGGRTGNDLSVSLPADSSPARGAKADAQSVFPLGSPFRGAVTDAVGD